MAHLFEIHPEALRRCFSVYVVVARGEGETLLYVGKTGDNREGCNPLISRCGNHFSYNKLHSQARSKIPTREEWRYTYVFDHFDDYCEDARQRRIRIDRINEMERWLNTELQKAIGEGPGIRLLNSFAGRGYCSTSERLRRAAFHTPEAARKIQGIVAKVKQLLVAADADHAMPARCRGAGS